MTPSSFPSLPEFSVAPAIGGGDPELVALLASVASPVASAPGADGPGPSSLDFSRWLALPITAATAAEAPAAPAAPGLPLSELRLPPRLTVRPAGAEAAPLVDESGAASAAVEPQAAAMQPSATPAPATREELEAAAALLAPLGQELVAWFTATAAPATGAGVELVAVPNGVAGAPLPGPTAALAAAHAPQVRLTLRPDAGGAGHYVLTLPSTQVEEAPTAALPAAALPAERAESESGFAIGVRRGAALSFTTPEDLAAWVRRGFATLVGAQGAGAPGTAGVGQGRPPLSAPESLGLVNDAVGAEPQATVTAELTLADGTTLRIEVGHPLAGPVRGGPTERPLAFDARRPLATANNAGLPANIHEVASPADSSQGKKFLSDRGEALAEGRTSVGIAVAEPVGNMPFRSRLLPNDVPVAAAAFVVGSGRGSESALVPAFATERAPAPALAFPPATAALAGRAVSTVVNVVETQAASRMQPVPSVQLHFKFGGEDLSVRVELRGGEVRTEFRTDSGALRSALADEWRAVAAAPATGLRLLDPAFGPATARGSSFDSTSTGHQPSSQQHSSHQQHADARDPQDAQGVFGRVARSFAAPPLQPTTPAAPAVASLRANSRHLSVIA